MKWRTHYDGPRRRSNEARVITTIPQQIIPDKRDKLKQEAEKKDE